MPSIANKLFITAALVVLGASMSGAHACGMLSDPNSPDCKGPSIAGKPSTIKPVAKQAAPAINAATSVTAQVSACALTDKESDRCLIARPTAEQHDQAVQAGIDAAMSGMAIQQEAMRRAAELGIIPAALPPGLLAMPGGSPIAGGQRDAAQADQINERLVECVTAELLAVTKAGETLSNKHVKLAMEQCKRGVRKPN